MPVMAESFFRIFNSDVRNALRRFFENRSVKITPELASDFTDSGTLQRLTGLGLLEYDTSSSEYRLDDRTERFLEEMLGATEVAQADWLTGILDELNRVIEGIRGLADPLKGETLMRRIARLLRTCESRAQRHLEEVSSAVEIDYRAGSDYEIKLMKLQWHLERAHNYGEGVAQLDNLLRNNAFFQIQHSLEIITLRNRLIRRCDQVGDALIGIYQQIEEYLNRIQRDFERARKLIRLRGLLDRHEHLFATNLREMAESAGGPWFRDVRFRTLLDPTIVDRFPHLVGRVLRRTGISEHQGRTRRVEIQEPAYEDLPPIIDWQNIFEAFSEQHDDLFVFLRNVRIGGRPLTEEERIDAFCAILTNEDWSDAWRFHSFNIAAVDQWEYAVVQSAKTETQ